MILRAQYVVPVDQPPIRHGAVRIHRDRITAVDHADAVQPPAGDPVIDFGLAAIIPGLVNAHTHLELSALAGRVPPGPDFVRWINTLIDVRRRNCSDANAIADAVRGGVRASLAAGVTTIGDITARPDVVRPVLKHGPIRVVSFGEVIAVGAGRGILQDRLHAAMDGQHASEHLTIAVSPHAPYSVEPDGIRACADAAAENDLRLCMHLAETRDEVQFVETGGGPFRAFLTDLGLWDDTVPCPRVHPVVLADACAALTPRTLLAHVNYVDDAHIELLAARGASVAYCPRTHAAFGHDPHRFVDMLLAGVNVCIGTDSLASAPSLSPLDELRFLCAGHGDGHSPHPRPAADVLFAMATVRGARALGLADETGSLAVGKSADFTIIPLTADGPRHPLDNILASNVGPIETYVRGKRVHGPRL
ncbi:MAG: amidohydrolase family protein [Phycisphaerales bacterium]|nr:amidohydrolase family protein [Phycisphaerales bacterium]